jgi:hypothetical protein
MRNTARPFAVVISLGWIAAWIGALLLMWRPASEARLDLTDFTALGTIDTGGLARVVATIVSVAAGALALPVLVAVFQRTRPPVVEPAAASEIEHPHEPSHDLTEPVPGSEPDRDRETVPASLRSASTRGVGVSAQPVTTPGIHADRGDISSIQATLDRHDEEIHQLREMLTRRENAPMDRDEPATVAERDNSHAGSWPS